jgi:DNA ligase-1
METPLYGQDKNGKTKIWQCTVRVEPDGKAIATIQHGYVGGKLQTTVREYTEGKNIGRKNETTPLQQCTQETERKRQDKIEKEGYTESFSEEPATQTTIYPMLAHKYEPKTNSSKKHGIEYPCFVQPKLDGLRCIVYIDAAANKIKFQSRTGSQFVGLDHLSKSLTPIFSRNPKLIFDGELYTDQMPFEELAGLIKKKTRSAIDGPRVEKIEYHVYDLVEIETPFVERFAHLHKILSTTIPPLSHVRLVPSITVQTVQEFKTRFTEYVEQGYEGIMLRNIQGKYQQGYRSHDLQKYKEFFEDEYEISGFKEGDGRDKGTVIWTCLTPDGREFSVRPRGTMETRRELYESATAKPDAYIGRHLTVIYQELSEQGVPRFPVGKDVRVAY